MTSLTWRAGVRRVWSYAKYIIALALVVLAVYQVTGDKSELTEAGAALHQLHWEWILLGVAAEVVSYLAFAQLQRTLLRAGRAYVGLGPMAGITLAANSITNSLPAGSVIAPVYSFRQFRRRGADQAVAGWSVVATFVTTAVTLSVLAAVGTAVAGAEGASLDLVPVIAVVFLLTVALGVVFVQERALIWAVTALWHLSQRLTGWPRGELAARIDRIIKRLTVVRLSPRQVVSALWLGLANWTFDCTCLAVSFLAVGAGVPWKGLLLAYGAGQLAANLPITPGGLGVVEGSITIAIVAFGGAATSTVVAVLLYRVISFWLILPAGWGAMALLAWSGRRRPWTMPVAAGKPGGSGTGNGGAEAATGSADGEGNCGVVGR
jgi:uncharacterized protein (TIRG00374 family)